MSRKESLIVGWREWVSLPALHGAPMKAKIDSGAKTSALHAQGVQISHRDGSPWVRFVAVSDGEPTVRHAIVSAPVVDFRSVQSSNGQSEVRPVIETELVVGERLQIIELTLTNRNQMGFGLLIGRSALNNILINPNKSFMAGAHVDRNPVATRTQSRRPLSGT